MLDSVQEKIAHADDKVFSVFAGAGSGKTRVVCERARWLIEERGCDPSDIVIFTFTKKAAGEIQERLEDYPDVIAGTFHSILLQWVKQNCEYLEGFEYGIETVATPEEIANCKNVTGREFSRRTAAEYQCISFDLILELGLELLQKMPHLMSGIHFIVDEAQDNSKEQWDVVHAISEHKEIASLMVVGDFRQSIYEWRGAKPELGKEFCDQHKTYYLSKNYRNGKAIVDHAFKTIVRGGFDEPMLWCSGLDGEIKFCEEQSPVHSLASKIVEINEVHSVPYHDIAVLCRYNGMADMIADHIQREWIPAYRKNPTWELPLSRLCAWASLMANPHNEIAWSVAMGSLLGPGDKAKLINLSHSCGTNLFDLTLIQGIEVPVKRKLQAFDPDTIWKIWEACGGNDCDLIKTIMRDFSGFPCEQFAEAVCMDDRSASPDGVCVGTMHSVKGLEFDTVFIINCCETIMPARKRGRGLEEERRLLYVAQTRAINRLIYINDTNKEWSSLLMDEHGRFLL